MNAGIPMADASPLIKYLQDYRRPFTSCKPNEGWTHIALHCYNESEKELFLYEIVNRG